MIRNPLRPTFGRYPAPLFGLQPGPSVVALELTVVTQAP
jgi:hypothetical protein